MRNRFTFRLLAGLVASVVAACAGAPARETAAEFDVVLRGGLVYDGSGSAPLAADVAIVGDRIVAIGKVAAGARLELDVTGLAVAPGFINMLSWADETLLTDPRSLSDISQGVTLEVFGEGSSMGPLDAAMRARLIAGQGEQKYDVPWTTLGEYLQHLEARGVSPNVASFVGATTVRIHELGLENRTPSAEQLTRMQELVRQAMREGALGVGSSLPYVPATFATTAELQALALAAAEFGGMYISHIRNEGEELLTAIEEFLAIVRHAGGRGEIYHLKASGKGNWGLLDEAIRRVEAARASGLAVTADIYPYAASATGLTINLPAWVQEGGQQAMTARLLDPPTRARVLAELDMIPPTDILLTTFRNEALRPLAGKTLAEVAALRGTSPEETMLDLLVEDQSRIGTVRFTMSEDNVAKAMALPWVSFCSDASSIAPELPYTKSNGHPRAYGAFARVLAKYVRDERIVSLEEAVRRLSGLPANNLRLVDRGLLRPGYFADVVVFDAATIQDHATFAAPHQLATGVRHVLVSGQPVLRDGEHTGAKPGRFVRGPGWRQIP
jgi:N-acyl-D-amino-acid deacylase